MKIIYVASPYHGDGSATLEQNAVKAMEAANILIDKGYGVIQPLLCHFYNQYFPQPEERWLRIDLELVSRADALLRLPGESHGADMEVEHAKIYNIPVFYSIEELEKATLQRQMWLAIDVYQEGFFMIGIFDTEAQAYNACSKPNHLIGPLDKNVNFTKHPTEHWDGSYYPLQEEDNYGVGV